LDFWRALFHACSKSASRGHFLTPGPLALLLTVRKNSFEVWKCLKIFDFLCRLEVTLIVVSKKGTVEQAIRTMTLSRPLFLCFKTGSEKFWGLSKIWLRFHYTFRFSRSGQNKLRFFVFRFGVHWFTVTDSRVFTGLGVPKKGFWRVSSCMCVALKPKGQANRATCACAHMCAQVCTNGFSKWKFLCFLKFTMISDFLSVWGTLHRDLGKQAPFWKVASRNFHNMIFLMKNSLKFFMFGNFVLKLFFDSVLGTLETS
jgi:hypothetical protein